MDYLGIGDVARKCAVYVNALVMMGGSRSDWPLG